MTPKDNFLFLASWRDAIAVFPDDVRLAVYEAAIDYALGRVEDVGLTGVPAACFAFMKQDIDRQQERYEAKCERNRQNIRRRWNRASTAVEETIPNDTNDTTVYDAIQKEKEKEKEIYNNFLTSKEESGQGPDPAPDPPEISEKTEKTDYAAIVGAYHEICRSFPKLKTVTQARKDKMKLRNKEMGGDLNTWRELFERMQASDFMKGLNRQNWSANFDWIIANGQNWVKVLEGNYDNKASPGSGHRDPMDEYEKYIAKKNAKSP